MDNVSERHIWHSATHKQEYYPRGQGQDVDAISENLKCENVFDFIFEFIQIECLIRYGGVSKKSVLAFRFFSRSNWIRIGNKKHSKQTADFSRMPCSCHFPTRKKNRSIKINPLCNFIFISRPICAALKLFTNQHTHKDVPTIREKHESSIVTPKKKTPHIHARRQEWRHNRRDKKTHQPWKFTSQRTMR